MHQVLKKSRGFTLLLFEGSAPENEDMEKHLKNKVLSFKELQALSVSMKCQADKTNFVAMIDEVVLFPQGDVEAHERFGVHGQCCFVVRPDHHVGFRCEPIRSGAIWRYFRQTCGISHGRNEEAPLSSHVFDPLPALVWTLSLLLILYFIFF